MVWVLVFSPALAAVVFYLSLTPKPNLMAQEAVLRTNLHTLRSCMDSYEDSFGARPSSLQQLVQQGYLLRVPLDPFTGSSETWRLERSTQGSRREILDVRSGSTALGSNGIPYNRW